MATKEQAATQDRMPRILLIHGSGLGNVGDSAQMFAAMERLEKTIPNCQVVVAKMYATDDGSLWGNRENAPSPHLYVCQGMGIFARFIVACLNQLKAVRLATAFSLGINIARAMRLFGAAWFLKYFHFVPLIDKRARDALLAIRSCDLLYCSGGGNLNDIWLKGELLPRVLTYRIAQLFGKPVIVSGQGIGPIHGRLGKWLLEWGTKHVKIIACRDKHESQDLLLQLGINPTVIQSLGDEATDLRRSDPQRIAEILAAEGVPDDGRPLAAVHVRLHNFQHDFRATAIPLLAELLDRLVEKNGCRILFIPVSYWKTKVYEGDLGDAFEVYARMRHRENVSFICREKYSPPDMKGIVSVAKIMIAFSYHAWVFAMTQGIPAFGLFFGEYFRAKSQGLYEWYELQNWVWNTKSLDVDDVYRTINDVLINYDLHQEKLLDVTRRMVEQVQIPAQIAGECLGNP